MLSPNKLRVSVSGNFTSIYQGRRQSGMTTEGAKKPRKFFLSDRNSLNWRKTT